MNKKTIQDIDVQGKKVLVRVDFNVPLDDNRNITDDSRIRAALPSIQYVIDNGGKLILMSHLGRPKGEVKEEFNLSPVALRLTELINREVKKLDDCVGEEVEEAVSAMKEGDVILLENLRFHKEETKNDPDFSKKLEIVGVWGWWATPNRSQFGNYDQFNQGFFIFAGYKPI